MNKKRQALKYIICDYFAAACSWALFYIYRKLFIETDQFGHHVSLTFNHTFYYALLILPPLWVFLFYISGTYKNVYHKSRIKEFGQTFLVTFIGCIILFFTLLLNDKVGNYKNYYFTFIVLLGLQFCITYFLRFIITTTTIKQIERGDIGFNTLIIGTNKNALALYEDFINQPISRGNKFIGFTHIEKEDNYLLDKYLTHLGNFIHLKETIEKFDVEEVIIAIEKSEQDHLDKIIDVLYDTNVVIKVIPNTYDILRGSVKMSAILGAPLITINPEIMPPWQSSIKRILDVFSALLIFIIGSPIYLITSIFVKFSSKGSVFFKQERIGQFGKPFYIYKFRSMYVDAEKNGPALSSKNDPRITKFGHFMRKTRLDEIPQFYNVIKGEMSLVGPRPERKFYIEQIQKKAPYYNHLFKIKPGITSWGQVRYGYAENVDQMIERLKYDILYIENMSLIVDFRILIYTVLIVLKGKGK